MKIQTTIFYLASILSFATSGNQVTLAQATATGSVTMSGAGGYLQSVSGQISLPAGSFAGPLVITPTVTIANPAPIDSLLINPGGINFTLPPTLNATAAALLDSTTNLSDIVSIIRANTNFLDSSSPNQASATGSTTLLYPDGSTESVSGEVALPNGLYYDGALTGGCLAGSGCLLITPTISSIPQDFTVPRIDRLLIDPGAPNIFNPVYDFNAAAAQKLTAVGLADLSDAVSIIRAGKGANGPYSSSAQARASGSVTISTPNGSTQSVSGEVTLPAGLYYDFSTDPSCTGGACLTIQPDIQWSDTSGNPITGAQANSAYINQLSLNPGTVQPGDPSAPTGLLAANFDFNAAAAYILYLYVDDPSSNLSNVVSVIRAGAGANGLSPTNRPQARATGTATISTPNGSTQSVSGEVSLPQGLYYTGSTNSLDPNCAGAACLVITPDFGTTIPINASDDPNLVLIQNLTVDPGIPNDPTTIKPWDFDAAAAYALTQAADLQGQVSIIRAGAGSNGLE